jgi:uncharacterized damage-inducible protein DinB
MTPEMSASTLRAQALLMARYNLWATRRLLDAVAPLSDADYRRDVGLFFRSVHGTLNHLLVAEHALWFRRFAEGVSPSVALEAEIEPDRARVAERLLAGAAAWGPLIESWPDARFTGVLSYQRMAGGVVSLPFTPTLLHVFNHGTHHRGQVSAGLTMRGQPGPVLDLVFMLQQEAAL